MLKVQVRAYLEGERADLLNAFAARTGRSRNAHVSRLIKLDLGAKVERVDHDLRSVTTALRTRLEHANSVIHGRAQCLVRVPSAGSV